MISHWVGLTLHGIFLLIMSAIFFQTCFLIVVWNYQIVDTIQLITVLFVYSKFFFSKPLSVGLSGGETCSLDYKSWNEVFSCSHTSTSSITCTLFIDLKSSAMKNLINVISTYKYIIITSKCMSPPYVLSSHYRFEFGNGKHHTCKLSCYPPFWYK